MRFTVVMASYLGEYRTAARDRDKKIVRAINSVINQSFTDWEMIVVADGCQKTMDIVSKVKDLRVKSIMVDRDKLWSGGPRNKGIELAQGEFIVYLDVDDLYGNNHLKEINEGLNGFDWVWFDDVRYSVKNDEWYQNLCDIMVIGKHGTSNICHKKSLPYRWDHKGYAHDHYFIKHLRQNSNYKKIAGGEYYVCHLPDSTLGKGYDL